MAEIIRTDKLVKNYYRNQDKKDPSAKIEVLKGLDITIEDGEYVAIMGSSGGGKTTLLKILGMMEPLTEGKLYFKGQDSSLLWKDELADIRRREIGFVFQDFYLMDSLTVEENIMLPMILDKAEEENCYESARGYAEHFQINALMRKYPYELSGGERQRVAICRALVNRPDLILADEPTGNLDSQSGKIVIDALDQIHKEHKKTIIMVTHDPQVASYCSRIILLKDGLILDELKNGGNREEFYQEILGRMVDL